MKQVRKYSPSFLPLIQIFEFPNLGTSHSQLTFCSGKNKNFVYLNRIQRIQYNQLTRIFSSSLLFRFQGVFRRFFHWSFPFKIVILSRVKGLMVVKCALYTQAYYWGGSNSIFVHGHPIFGKCTCTKCTKCTKTVFSCLEVPWKDLLAVANSQ